MVGDGITAADAEKHVARARQLSLSLLYWLQTECPRPDGKLGWKGLKLRPDLVGTEDGLAKAALHPRIAPDRGRVHGRRAARRHREPPAATKTQDVQAQSFPDSVGVGSYGIDLHPSTGGDNYIDISSLPFQIPLGALIPAGREPAAGLQEPGDDPRHQRLLPAPSGRVGDRRGRRGTCRILPGSQGIAPVGPNTPNRLAAFQARLAAQGVEIAWPRLTPR